MGNKVLFYMNVDWNWIKQRPHFLAEGLSKYSKTTIVYQYRYNRKGYQKRDYGSNDVHRLYVIPRIDRYWFLSWINDIIRWIELSVIIFRTVPNIIVLTYPEQIRYFPRKKRISIIYDCMDQYDAFAENEIDRKRIIKYEKKMCENAYKILTSSDYLKKKIIEKKYLVNSNDIVVVRNAYDGKLIKSKEDKENKNTILKLGYFGTISKWFDFDTLIALLELNNDIEFYLYGPCDEVKIPLNPRIIYQGVIEHSMLYDKTKDIDVFIIPFIVNEIVKAVDPVKIYEYINFNKNVICVRYDEVERFSEMIYLYKDVNEFDSIVKSLKINNKNKYNEKMRFDFLMSNTWNERVKKIAEIIGEDN